MPKTKQAYQKLRQIIEDRLYRGHSEQTMTEEELSHISLGFKEKYNQFLPKSLQDGIAQEKANAETQVEQKTPVKQEINGIESVVSRFQDFSKNNKASESAIKNIISILNKEDGVELTDDGKQFLQEPQALFALSHLKENYPDEYNKVPDKITSALPEDKVKSYNDLAVDLKKNKNNEVFGE